MTKDNYAVKKLEQKIPLWLDWLLNAKVAK
jgi:hypothetical protein